MAERAADGELRADARRNREGLLAVAREVFAEQGTDASLRDVARRAGVGIGTLYRHFPTRDALLEAALSKGFEEMRQAADRLLDADAPAQALARWLRDLALRSGTYRGLPASVLAALGDPDSELHGSCAAMRRSAGRLLERAQRAGAVRQDVEADDLFAAAAATGWVAELAGPDRADRVLALISGGLPPAAAAAGLPRADG